ncbi:MAG: hypothetical protein Q9207_003512 [Kuettlingeria erythrocarpa]
MSFHFKVDLSLAFPPPPPRSRTQSPVPSPAHSSDAPQNKKGPAKWMQTARQHPQFNLRRLYFIVALIGIIVGNVALAYIPLYADFTDVHRTALVPLILFLLFQPITLFAPRLFRFRRPIPNWALAIVETLGFLAFLGLIISNALAIDKRERWGRTTDATDITLTTYDSAVWIALCLLHFTLAIQCYAQGWRNIRPKRESCPHCESGHGKGKGKGPASDHHDHDEEEALLGATSGAEEHEDEAPEAGPSEQPVVPERYRDEADRGESTS